MIQLTPKQEAERQAFVGYTFDDHLARMEDLDGGFDRNGTDGGDMIELVAKLNGEEFFGPSFFGLPMQRWVKTFRDGRSMKDWITWLGRREDQLRRYGPNNGYDDPGVDILMTSLGIAAAVEAWDAAERAWWTGLKKRQRAAQRAGHPTHAPIQISGTSYTIGGR